MNAVAFCRNKSQGSFTDDMCWWSHIEKRDIVNECYLCNENFETKGQMMKHRKKKHNNIINNCVQFERNECRFQEESCWYNHPGKEDQNSENDSEDIIDDVDENEKDSEPVFQKVSENLKPPIVKQKLKKTKQD